MMKELRHRITIAHDVVNTRQALAAVVHSLLAKATAQVETREVELKLASLREIEARHRVEYYCRLSEVATEEVTHAEMQAAVLRIQGRKIGSLEEVTTLKVAWSPLLLALTRKLLQS
ncbi:hypothetical protein K438DRAFT_1776498 [Mycena galopus ATCC 62051]|nr:hypothetical protein K438DRAFT_1776498 [Mycena galopus ATCC 62051]